MCGGRKWQGGVIGAWRAPYRDPRGCCWRRARARTQWERPRISARQNEGDLGAEWRMLGRGTGRCAVKVLVVQEGGGCSVLAPARPVFLQRSFPALPAVVEPGPGSSGSSRPSLAGPAARPCAAAQRRRPAAMAGRNAVGRGDVSRQFTCLNDASEAGVRHWLRCMLQNG